MKIIAESNSGYVVELSHHELLTLLGFDSQYSPDFDAFLEKHGALERGRGGKIGVAVPCEVPLSEWWRRLSEIRSSERKLGDIAFTLRGLADLVDGAWPVIKAKLPTDAPDSTS